MGGFIQAVEPFDDPNVLLLCNEEAKLLGLPENRFLRNRNGIPYDIIHGTFFLAQGSGEEFCSLTDKQIQTCLLYTSQTISRPQPAGSVDDDVLGFLRALQEEGEES